MIPALDLFSGIGGFTYGLELTGRIKTVAFCEIEPWPRKLLKHYWPEVPIYDDVKTLTWERLRADGVPRPRIIVGGFPCQDISTAGRGAGLAGERSGLWTEQCRLIGEIRPDFAVVENVAALLARGLGVVLGDLAEIGYDAEWHCIPAAAVGAPHRRDRIWIVAYPQSEPERPGLCESAGDLPDADQPRLEGRPQPLGDEPRDAGQAASGGLPADVADAAGGGQPRPRLSIHACHPATYCEGQAGDVEHVGLGGVWPAEPDVGRVAYGIPNRVDRLKGLGNAVVPQIPQLIGEAILDVIDNKAA